MAGTANRAISSDTRRFANDKFTYTLPDYAPSCQWNAHVVEMPQKQYNRMHIFHGLAAISGTTIQVSYRKDTTVKSLEAW